MPHPTPSPSPQRARLVLACVVLAALACAGGCRASVDALSFKGDDAIAWGPEQDVTPRDPRRVRFAVIGDAGVRDDDDPSRLHYNTLAVARAVLAACAPDRGGCDFATFNGDNVYTFGVRDGVPEDAAFFKAFVDAYSPLGPLYFVLGNHDWGTMLHYDTEVARNQLNLIRRLPKARGATHFYTFAAGSIDLWAWDTTYLLFKCWSEEHGMDCYDNSVQEVLTLPRTAPRRGWKIAFGHHPFRSNGRHGNAGSYLTPTLRGVALGDFMRRELIGHVDLYLSGHDHDLQLYAHTDNGDNADLGATALVHTGAGAKCRERSGHGNQATFERFGALGFAIVEATADTLTVTQHTVSLQNPSWRPVFTAQRARDAAVWDARALAPDQAPASPLDMSDRTRPDDLHGCTE